MQELREILVKAIKDLYDIDFDVEITPAPENIDADYSSNVCLKLAKELHKKPMEIAGAVTKTILSSSGLIRVFVTPPGFINFKLGDEFLYDKVDNLSRDFAVKSDKFAGQTVVCEFSDPNPFKVLHVGHLYTSVVGDAISRLFEYAGARVVRANFGGDVGLHVAKTIYVLKQKDLQGFTIEDIARCYVEGTAAYEDDEGAKAEITKLNKEIYKINAENIHGTEISDLYWRGRELSYEYFKDFYAKIGVEFDKYYPESTVAALGLETVLRELDNGVYEKSDGAVVFDGEKYGLHTRVFVNKEGVPTYEAKDVGLIFTKWQDWHFDKSVVITGNEQLDYMRVVLKSVEQYAPELVEKTAHLTHGLVKLPGNVKMSSRKGNFLKAMEVMGMVEEELKSEYDSSDSKVVLAALKYAFLRYKMGGDIIFDVKESVNMTGNSGPYLLYSAVRAKKIMAGAMFDRSILGPRPAGPFAFGNSRPKGRAPRAAGASPRAAALRNPSNRDDSNIYSFHERKLVKKLLEYVDVLDTAVAEMAPHKLANYLYELAQEFSRFYENCQVIGAPEEKERVKLVQVYLDTMTHGLNILGIEIPEEM